MKAFVLGAGLGTRLRPLTDWLPKPLVPIFHQPLVAYAFDHLIAHGVDSFIVNTHHYPDGYARLFPGERYRGSPLAFRHEPVLLETGGGIRNIGDLLEDETFLVYNGDILSDIPLETMLAEHRRSNREVTLLLRSSGPAPHIGWDSGTGLVADIHGRLGRVTTHHLQFTGIYAVEPAFLQRFAQGEKTSVIPVFFDLIREGTLGACLEDRGAWWDLGDPSSYLEAHAALPDSGFPAYQPETQWQTVHPNALIAGDATIGSGCCVGAGAVVESGARLTSTVVWPGATVAPDSIHHRHVVRGDRASFFTHFSSRQTNE